MSETPANRKCNAVRALSDAAKTLRANGKDGEAEVIELLRKELELRGGGFYYHPMEQQDEFHYVIRTKRADTEFDREPEEWNADHDYP